MKIYTIYDKKAKLGSNLFPAENFEVAKRIVSCSLDGESTLVHYPADYDLREVGIYDADLCKVAGYDKDDFSNGYPVINLIPESLKKYCLDGSFSSE